MEEILDNFVSLITGLVPTSDPGIGFKHSDEDIEKLSKAKASDRRFGLSLSPILDVAPWGISQELVVDKEVVVHVQYVLAKRNLTQLFARASEDVDKIIFALRNPTNFPVSSAVELQVRKASGTADLEIDESLRSAVLTLPFTISYKVIYGG
jgi:hypothetical protein